MAQPPRLPALGLPSFDFDDAQLPSAGAASARDAPNLNHFLSGLHDDLDALSSDDDDGIDVLAPRSAAPLPAAKSDADGAQESALLKSVGSFDRVARLAAAAAPPSSSPTSMSSASASSAAAARSGSPAAQRNASPTPGSLARAAMARSASSAPASTAAESDDADLMMRVLSSASLQSAAASPAAIAAAAAQQEQPVLDAELLDGACEMARALDCEEGELFLRCVEHCREQFERASVFFKGLLRRENDARTAAERDAALLSDRLHAAIDNAADEQRAALAEVSRVHAESRAQLAHAESDAAELRNTVARLRLELTQAQKEAAARSHEASTARNAASAAEARAESAEKAAADEHVRALSAAAPVPSERSAAGSDSAPAPAPSVSAASADEAAVAKSERAPAVVAPRETPAASTEQIAALESEVARLEARVRRFETSEAELKLRLLRKSQPVFAKLAAMQRDVAHLRVALHAEQRAHATDVREMETLRGELERLQAELQARPAAPSTDAQPDALPPSPVSAAAPADADPSTPPAAGPGSAARSRSASNAADSLDFFEAIRLLQEATVGRGALPVREHVTLPPDACAEPAVAPAVTAEAPAPAPAPAAPSSSPAAADAPAADAEPTALPPADDAAVAASPAEPSPPAKPTSRFGRTRADSTGKIARSPSRRLGGLSRSKSTAPASSPETAEPPSSASAAADAPAADHRPDAPAPAVEEAPQRPVVRLPQLDEVFIDLEAPNELIQERIVRAYLAKIGDLRVEARELGDALRKRAQEIDAKNAELRGLRGDLDRRDAEWESKLAGASAEWESRLADAMTQGDARVAEVQAQLESALTRCRTLETELELVQSASANTANAPKLAMLRNNLPLHEKNKELQRLLDGAQLSLDDEQRLRVAAEQRADELAAAVQSLTDQLNSARVKASRAYESQRLAEDAAAVLRATSLTTQSKFEFEMSNLRIKLQKTEEILRKGVRSVWEGRIRTLQIQLAHEQATIRERDEHLLLAEKVINALKRKLAKEKKGRDAFVQALETQRDAFRDSLLADQASREKFLEARVAALQAELERVRTGHGSAASLQRLASSPRTPARSPAVAAASPAQPTPPQSGDASFTINDVTNEVTIDL